MCTRLYLGLALLLACAPLAHGQETTLLRTVDFQAALVATDGEPYSCLNCTVDFAIYSTADGGTALWTEQYPGLTVDDGLLAVKLGSREPLATLSFETEHWLEIKINDEPLEPRLEMTAVPYALVAGTVDRGGVTTVSIAEAAVTRPKIALGAIDAARLADEAVTREKIAGGAVDTDRIALEAVTTDRLASDAVTTEKIADGAITPSKLGGTDADEGDVLTFDGSTGVWMPPGSAAPSSITAAMLADEAVTENKLAGLVVTTPKLGELAVTTPKLADEAVTEDKLADGAVTADKIADGAVTRAKIPEGAIDSDRIADGAVTGNKLDASGASPGDVLTFDGTAGVWLPPGSAAPGSITTVMVADEAVTSDKLADDAVTTPRLADEAVTADKLADLAVTTPRIGDSAVTREKIALDAVDTDRIAAGAVDTDRLADEAVTADKIADGSVTPEKLDVAGASEGDVLTFDGATGAWAPPLPAAPGSITSELLASGSVTADKIDIDDAAAGDVLMLVDGTLSWAQPPGAEGLVLPYVGEVSEVEAAFEIRNLHGDALLGRAAAGLNNPRLVGVRGEAVEPHWLQDATWTWPTEAFGMLGQTFIGQTQVGLWGRSSHIVLDAHFPHFEAEGQSYGVVGDGDDIGVFGYGTHGTGVVGQGAEIGVRAEGGWIGLHARSQDGLFGVIGENNVASPSSELSAGVAGFGGRFGVIGVNNTTFDEWSAFGLPIRAGVYGAGASYAGYFQGQVHVQGVLTKSGGSFRIDHPLDPANRWLSHSFVESPDMMNVYNGNVELDASGEAVVELPDYFQALNRDFRYQLTAIGAPGPNLYIAQEISGNRFSIAGGTPGARVSWQVTGIRSDAWAEQNRIQVEEVKAPEERGRYYGQE